MNHINQVIHNDVLAGMKHLPDKSIDCVITSPPYWQLRNYQWDGQWGLESTFTEYLEHLWQFMDEAWRVLKPEGTVWVNLGDTYGTISGNMRNPGESKETNHAGIQMSVKQSKSIHKSLLLIPHRFAIGCMERGWIIRNDVIWAKRNGMPESVTDRFSKKHEYFFLMTKQAKYYFDLDGIRDKHKPESLARNMRNNNGSEGHNYSKRDKGKMFTTEGKNPGTVSDFWDIPTSGNPKAHYATYNNALIEKPIIAGCPPGGIVLDPFCGTGTTLGRALQLGRNVIGIEGKKEYADECKLMIAANYSELNFV